MLVALTGLEPVTMPYESIEINHIHHNAIYFVEIVGVEPTRRDSKSPMLPLHHISIFAVTTGLEPATSCVTGKHSNQLNYATLLLIFLKLSMYS